MQNLIPEAGFKTAIQLLEAECADKERLLKEQFNLTLESLKPANLLRSSINNVATSPHFIDNILGAALGLATGFITRKLIVGASVNVGRKLFGSILLVGVTGVVAKLSPAVKSIGRNILGYLVRKKN